MAGTGLRGLGEAMAVVKLSARGLGSASRSGTSTHPPRIALSPVSQRTLTTDSTPAPPPSTPLATLTASRRTWPGLAPGTTSPTATVPLTIHRFPSLEPTRLEQWPAAHLDVPLRRDILHAAVVFEGDAARQGTASTKTRWTVHGSHRKIKPQKGSGTARAGWAQSPTRRGGGKSFGPHPRDFSSALNRKVYDRAWRTALSWRWRRGELVVVDGALALGLPADFGFAGLSDALARGYLGKVAQRLVGELGAGFAHTGSAAGKDPARTRTLFVAGERRGREDFFDGMAGAAPWGQVLPVADVDVKDLLEPARVVIERSALLEIVALHQSDLESDIVYVDGSRKLPPSVGPVLAGDDEGSLLLM